MTLRLQYSAVQLADRPNNLPALPTPRRPAGELKLGRMGYTPSQIEKLKILMDAPNGIVIFTGPTGTGKTTALFEVLQELARVKPHRRLVTIEEPVEYPMDWGIQLEVTGTRNDSESGTAFGDRLRVGLRMAPNIFLIGELRGPDVAIYALEASVTGHQVWTTMHVTDPFIFVERLELMDAERLQRRVFCDHKIVRGVVAQRLLAKLCQQCSVLLSDHPDALSKRIVTALGTWGDISKVRVRGRGCEHCGHDGTLERFAVAEVVITDAKLMADFINHGSDTARENYRAQRHADPSMLESGIMHSLAGIVDPRDVEEAIDLIEVKDRRRRHE